MKYLLFLISLNAVAGPVYLPIKNASVAGITDYTNNLIFDLDAQSITASDGSGVATWTSSEPNAYAFTGGGGAANPYFTNSVSLLNNKKGVTFLRASSQYVNKAGVSYIARNYTVIAVVVCYDGANGSDEEILHFSNGGSQTIQFCANTGSDKVGWYDGSFHEPAANTTGAQIISWELNSTGTAGAVYRNGTQIGSALVYTQGATDSFYLGIYQNLSANAFNGIIARLRVYDGDIGAANRLHAEEALGNFYGITVP
jgi:hypothetical protein